MESFYCFFPWRTTIFWISSYIFSSISIQTSYQTGGVPFENCRYRSRIQSLPHWPRLSDRPHPGAPGCGLRRRRCHERQLGPAGACAAADKWTWRAGPWPGGGPGAGAAHSVGGLLRRVLCYGRRCPAPGLRRGGRPLLRQRERGPGRPGRGGRLPGQRGIPGGPEPLSGRRDALRRLPPGCGGGPAGIGAGEGPLPSQ